MYNVGTSCKKGGSVMKKNVKRYWCIGLVFY